MWWCAVAHGYRSGPGTPSSLPIIISRVTPDSLPDDPERSSTFLVVLDTPQHDGRRLSARRDSRRHGCDGRHARSARSRRSIVDRRRPAFVEDGYVGTTIEAVAELAGLSVQTVTHVREQARPVERCARRHDRRRPRRIPLIERELGDTLDVAHRREAPHHLGIGVHAGVGADLPIFAVLAGLPPTRAWPRCWTRTVAADRHDLDGLVASSPATDCWRRLTVRTAADALFTIASEDVYLLLVDDCGWSEQQLQTWITDAISPA